MFKTLQLVFLLCGFTGNTKSLNHMVGIRVGMYFWSDLIFSLASLWEGIGSLKALV